MITANLERFLIFESKEIILTMNAMKTNKDNFFISLLLPTFV